MNFQWSVCMLVLFHHPENHLKNVFVTVLSEWMSRARAWLQRQLCGESQAAMEDRMRQNWAKHLHCRDA